MATPTALPVRHVEHCMGTVFSFDIRSPGVDRAALDRAVAWLHHVDATFSTYRADSEISRIADGRLALAQAGHEVRDVLARCAEFAERTGGFFTGLPRGALDPSGYVKGWATEVASDLLQEAGSRNHCVNGGGDVQCIGLAAPSRPWRVGIADPLRPGGLLSAVEGRGRLAVATSGTGERGAHVVDPHTGRAPDGLASVTVIGSRLAEVDALATAAFAMGAGAPRWLAGQAALRALVVRSDGTTWRTGQLCGDSVDSSAGLEGPSRWASLG